jgi:hypothetical protein
VDIFAREDNEQVASMLNTHLRWWESLEDNLVSWTSSLLFALVYIFHLHANSRDGSAFEDIFLCIIDTTMFPKGVFLRDMDLIEVYLSFDAALENFNNLRFEEGLVLWRIPVARCIEDRRQMPNCFSSGDIIDQGLYDLRREFEEFAHWEPFPTPPWAYPVVDLRKDLYQIECPEISKEKLRVAVNIAQLFGPRWTLPVAANLVALLPGPKEDVAIIQAFRANVFTGSLLLPRSITQADASRRR